MWWNRIKEPWPVVGVIYSDKDIPFSLCFTCFRFQFFCYSLSIFLHFLFLFRFFLFILFPIFHPFFFYPSFAAMIIPVSYCHCLCSTLINIPVLLKQPIGFHNFWPFRHVHSNWFILNIHFPFSPAVSHIIIFLSIITAAHQFSVFIHLFVTDRLWICIVYVHVVQRFFLL